jgi:hypothetical protein
MRVVLDSAWLTLLYPILLFGCLLLGIIYSHRFYHRRKRVWKLVGIENGLLGIFALLLSFTMVVSGNFVRERADCIHAEAEELALIFRTSKFYDDSLQEHVHQYLRDFLRIQLGKKTPSISECAQLIDSIQMIEAKLDLFLWNIVEEIPQ